MWTKKKLENRAFRNNDITIIMCFPTGVFLKKKKKKKKKNRLLLLFQISPAIVDEKQFMRFQSKTFVFKFLHRNVD